MIPGYADVNSAVSHMAYREIHYSWEYELKSTPEKLWPFVADTNRFNRDTGVPSIEAEDTTRQRLRNARRRLRLSFLGLPVEWEEQPFEWVRPSRFGVTRSYTRGPVAELKVVAELSPLSGGGTRLNYQVWATPKSLLGFVVIPLQIGLISARKFARAFKRYDQSAADELFLPGEQEAAELSTIARSRLAAGRERLVTEGVPNEIAVQLTSFLEQAADFSLARISPYVLADEWNEPRRAVLEACLRATRAGLLDLRWDLLCPLCRGPQESESSLSDIKSKVHCETCRIDFTVNFDRFVEITFRPNASIRIVDVKNYCMGSPQKTPHIVAQQLLPAQTSRKISMPLEEGRYRLRVLELPGERLVTVTAGGEKTASVHAAQDVSGAELNLSTHSTLDLENSSAAEQLFIVERLSWSDQAATAAEVTALQVFRDLFSSEALRPGDQVSVGTLTVLFTDLRNSTKLYREIGDATAFGRVMSHFDVLKKTIAEEDGALVKTIGDAVMAVFRNPAAALEAMLRAQRELASPSDGSSPLTLKAGIHIGPCIAVTLNERLDYFGSTVNMAARLESLSTGGDVVISAAVYNDPEVRQLIETDASNLQVERFEMGLKGFDQERFELWRVMRRAADASVTSS
ncbi:MAG: adenylate/guanylate cyclase domain-containing protein [bacterium]